MCTDRQELNNHVQDSLPLIRSRYLAPLPKLKKQCTEMVHGRDQEAYQARLHWSANLEIYSLRKAALHIFFSFLSWAYYVFLWWTICNLFLRYIDVAVRQFILRYPAIRLQLEVITTKKQNLGCLCRVVRISSFDAPYTALSRQWNAFILPSFAFAICAV